MFQTYQEVYTIKTSTPIYSETTNLYVSDAYHYYILDEIMLCDRIDHER